MVLDKLMIITNYDKFYRTIQECCAFLEIEPVIFQWETASPELTIRLRETFASQGKPEVIVTWGALADIVETSFPDIVVLRAEPDDLDILESLEVAMVYGKRIGLLINTDYGRNYKIDVLKRILDLKELRFYSFRSAEDIRKRIAEGKSDGMDAMVGGGTLGVRTGKAVGIPVCFANTSVRSLERAVLQALSIINAHSRERLQLETFWNTTSLISEGILVLEDKTVILANQEMLHILAAKEDAILNQPISRLSPSYFSNAILQFFFEDSLPEKVLPVCDHKYLVKKRGTHSKGQKRLTVSFQNIIDIQNQEQQIRAALRDKGLSARFHFEDIKGNSPAIRTAKRKAALYAATDANILITGENGTGKEMFAQSIHNASIRKNNPFVAVNCAAIPEPLLESELFGYEEGSFSGAKRGGKPGLFELAQRGTLFLDEINSLPIQVQGVLLRAIQEKEIRRIGSQKNLAVDIRILSASNVQMDELIASGRFRADLYYRLNVLNLRLPPLCERKEDILPLAEVFLKKYAAQYHLELPVLTKEDRTFLVSGTWSGNVRSLENVIHRYTILQHGQHIPIRECMEDLTPSSSGHEIAVTPGTLEEIETELIHLYMKKNHGNRTETARQLGISRTTLWKKLNPCQTIT